ncbi:hypothetical protein GCM10009727_60130 [Actinomadura napierensis]|uniref:Uncharacterized protein n=1 Tax=Actinomadura napierensis TaxID=267854 RepID=A0ABN3A4B1_9ACTN
MNNVSHTAAPSATTISRHAVPLWRTGGLAAALATTAIAAIARSAGCPWRSTANRSRCSASPN